MSEVPPTDSSYNPAEPRLRKHYYPFCNGLFALSLERFFLLLGCELR